MRPAIGSALVLMCALLAARPAAGLSTDPPAASSAAEGAPRPVQDQGGKVKRNSNSPYAVVNITGTKTIKDNNTSHYCTLRGVASGRYLCLSRRRRQPFTSKYLRLNRCRFRLKAVRRKHTYIFLYERREDRQLHLAITAQGEARMRPVRLPPRYRRRGTAGRRRAQSREREPAPAATESAAELTAELPSLSSPRRASRSGSSAA
ncbi:hypothetical protein FJT64_009691 [Amphibalanus amphitrite]|uniref:Uncharacterized protein n=1 Tax=Amphibalanus amphitrite TaxID=1232801 RepID=A0A6A4VFG1_AMPAM|nr:hypothetical protein FJT64_009691 [Amphibalanus amphitrite]